MNRNNVPTTLFDRELGQPFDVSQAISKSWSASVTPKQPSQNLQFSNTKKIFFLNHRQNVLAILTNKGEAFVYNSFFPNTLERVLDSSWQVLKLTILDNNSIFLVAKSKQVRQLSFFSVPVSFINTQLLSVFPDLQINLDSLDQLDIYSNNLIVYSNHKSTVYDLYTYSIKHQANGPLLYSRDCVASIFRAQTQYEISIKNLNTGLTSLCIVDDCRQLDIMDLFPNYLIFAQSGKMFYIGCGDTKATQISLVPNKYLEGKFASVAVFGSYMIVMNQNWNRVELVPSVLCSDLPGVLVVFEKVNMRVVVVRENGEMLQAFSVNRKVVFITVNTETLELALGFKDAVEIFQ